MKGTVLFSDTHAHLDAAAFETDRDAVVARARTAGVHHIMTVGIDLATSKRAVDLATSYAGVSAAAGVHPSEADRFDGELPGIAECLRWPAVRAVGEIGLDYYRCPASAETQLHVFRAQLELAVSHDLPVIVHDRDAHADVFLCLRDYPVRGVLHCFSGDIRLATDAVDMGFFVSLAGNVTYPKATDLHEVARRLPLESLMVETDAPYLSPQTWRGKRNEPAYLVATVAAIGKLRDEATSIIADATTANAARLFGWSASLS